MRAIARATVLLTLTCSLAARVTAQDAAPAAGSEAAPPADEAAAPPETEVPDAASAEPTAAQLAEAQHSFELATAAYEGGDYETAAEEFRVAYEITRHPELLFNVYLAEERAGRPTEAAEALAR